MSPSSALEFYFDRIVLFRGQPGVVAAVALTAARYVLVAWLVAVVVAALGNLVVRSFASEPRRLDAALIRLCFRILSITARPDRRSLRARASSALSITPIIAGLGVGGLAVALAIRPTLENIVGGFVLFADKPVRVGEFCSFGDMMGTVEEIGLRSTRLRGLDRTVITVPNAEFAQMQIVNFTRRDMNLFQCKLGLRYETTPGPAPLRRREDQEAADPAQQGLARSRARPLQRVRRFGLYPGRVRLRPVGRTGTSSWRSRRTSTCGSPRSSANSGTGFAFPSQTVYLTRDHGIDTARGAATEAEVQQWREEKRLPFPEYDFAERAEMAGTMPFPPEGSPDYRPAPPPKPPAPAEAAAGKHHRGLGAWLKGRSQRSST